MLVAEIFGKVSVGTPPSDRLEDVLTSHVFSTFRYFGAVNPLIHFLNSARTLAGEMLSLRAVHRVEAFFWPRVILARRTREPDVMLVVDHSEPPRTVIVVEAKYESGPSDIEGADAEGNEPSGVAWSGDQLADDYIALRVGEWRAREHRPMPPPLIIASNDKTKVLYVTDHYELPFDVLRTAVAAVRRRLGDDEADRAEWSLFWVSWRQLTEILRGTTIGSSGRDATPEARFLQDLHSVLKARRLEPFDGVFRGLIGLVPYSPSFVRQEMWADLVPIPAYQRFFEVVQT